MSVDAGDGLLDTFDEPARAAKCAQSACAALRPLGIEAHAGCLNGEYELKGVPGTSRLYPALPPPAPWGEERRGGREARPPRRESVCG